jgi:hypothetical protein
MRWGESSNECNNCDYALGMSKGLETAGENVLWRFCKVFEDAFIEPMEPM